MPRNNNSRLKVQDKGETPPQTTSSLLNFVIPTEFIELPTQGKFYPSDHPLHNAETVEMRYMTAKETDILTSTSLLKKGVAVDRMLESLFVDKNIKASQLFIGDKNALILAARINGFGSEYTAQVGCQNCGKTSEHVFELNEVKPKEVPSNINFSTNGTFFIKLPKTGVEAECQLLTGDHEKELASTAEKKKRLKLPDTILTDQYKKIIVSLNTVSDRSTVEEFVDIMPAQDALHLRKEYESARPDMDMSYSYECESCNAENDVDIPFSANFFWPD